MMSEISAKTLRVAISCLLIGIVAQAAEAGANTPKLSGPIRADIKLMWETIPMHGERGKRASSARATEAAHRVFTTVPLVGMRRQELLRLIGDPKTSSDSIYNFPFYPVSKNTLVYRFDTGSGGWQFDFAFDRHDRVSKIVPRGIE